jgi:hypothetical protein
MSHLDDTLAGDLACQRLCTVSYLLKLRDELHKLGALLATRLETSVYRSARSPKFKFKIGKPGGPVHRCLEETGRTSTQMSIYIR